MKFQHLIIGFLFLFIGLNASAQFGMKNKKKWVASHIDKQGEKVEGYIYVAKTATIGSKSYDAPWNFQGTISFIEKSAFAKLEKVTKKDYTKYGPKDIEGYEYDGKQYVSMEYKGATKENPIGIKAKKYFLLKEIDDKMSLYYFYENPKSSTRPEEVAERGDDPNLLYQMGKDGKLKLLPFIKVEKELADCPEVIAKHKKGEYNLIGNKKGKSSKLGRMINQVAASESVGVKIVNDYNSLCK